MNDYENPSRHDRRGFLKLSGVALAASLAPGLLSFEADAAGNVVLKAVHTRLESTWGPLRGGGSNYQWMGFMHASPMYFDTEMQLHPYVFTSWTPNDDFTVWRFTILPEAVFSDGSPITAAEVKGSLEVAARPATQSQRIGQVLAGVVGFGDVSGGNSATMSGVAVIDDKTVEITLGSPDPVFYMRMASNVTPIVKASAMRDAAGDEIVEWWMPANNPAFSGPFRPTAIDLNAGTLSLEPNPSFFGSAPKLSAIEMQTVEDPVSVTALLQSGEFQMSGDIITPTLMSDLGEYFVGGALIPRGHHFWFDVNKEPTNDPKVRQALIMAVNRDDLMKVTFPNGPHKKADQILDAIAGVDESWVPYPFDPEGAKKLLAESSYGGPEKLPSILMVGISNPANVAAAQFIAEQWRQNLGIDRVDMKPNADAYSGPDQSRIQIFRDDASSRVPDAVVYLRNAIHSTSGTARTKMGGYKNDEIDRLLDEGAALPFEDPRRTELAQQAQRLFREDYMHLPWYYTVAPRFAMPIVKGVSKNLDLQYIEPWNITLE